MCKALFVLVCLIQTGHAWKYCSYFDQDSNDFLVQDFEAMPWNRDEIHLRLNGRLGSTIYPASISASGKTHLQPTMRIKIFKKSSGEEIYSNVKALNNYTNSSLLDGDDATIKVPIRFGLDKKLNNGDYYVVQMVIMKRCGKEVTCVENNLLV